VAINYKQNWLGLAWQWALAVLVQFIIVKILGAIVGNFIPFDFLKSDGFIGLLPGVFFGAYVYKKHKVELEHAFCFSLVFLGFFDILALLSGGPSKINWSVNFFLLECAPLWTFITDFFLGWHAGVGQNKDDIEYVDKGRYIRGVRHAAGISVPKVFEKFTKEETPEGIKAGVSLWGGHPFPFKRENQHFLIVGSPGAGKTQVIFPMVSQAFERGDKVIVWDIKGTFIQAFAGKEGVDLLAAWDKRSILWSPGTDIRSHLDCQQVASIMFPPNPKDSQPFFLDSARQILEAVFVYLDSKGDDWGWGDVWAILSKGRQEIAKLFSTFEDGKALAHVIGADSKATEDIYSTLIGQAQRTIRWYAKAWPQGSVSLRKWVHGNSGLLIIGGIPERADIAQATANIAIEMIANEVLSLPDDPNRRIWLFLDELATLGKLDSLLNAFSLGRSKGLCVVAGIQDIGKLEHHYGVQLAKSISNTFSTQIILRCSDHDTAQWASKNLGEQEVIVTMKSSGSSSGSEHTTNSAGNQDQLKTTPLYLSSEISHFDNLNGVIRVSGWPLLNVHWEYKPIPQEQLVTDEADWLNKKEKPIEKSLGPQAKPIRKAGWDL